MYAVKKENLIGIRCFDPKTDGEMAPTVFKIMDIKSPLTFAIYRDSKGFYIEFNYKDGKIVRVNQGEFITLSVGNGGTFDLNKLSPEQLKEYILVDLIKNTQGDK